ncbi:MAG TPA: hypothetical protein VI685_26795 [Candidatus Angelobacter sp.]
MSSSSVVIPPATAPSPAATSTPPPEVIQRLIDQVAGFNLYVVPDGSNTSSGSGATGLVLSETLHRFDVTLQRPDSSGVRASNTFGDTVGKVDIRWFMIPDSFVARPDRQPPATRIDPSISQRFVMQETTFSFGDGRDGFRSFGAGRTFPMKVGNEPRIVVGAIGNLTEGFGKFRGHEGNYTVCGDLTPNGFKGNILVRIQDDNGNLRTGGQLPPIQPQGDPDPQTTYLLWAAQKGKGSDQENSASLGPDGQLRGLNIPTQLKLLELNFGVRDGFQATDIEVGEVIGREIGFGRGSVPGADPSGTPLNPFLFEGVARYSFFDSHKNTVGAITTNVLDGRRFDMRLPAAPTAPGLRFGFFGPILYGQGCFAGFEGMFYGATASVFNPPPGDHVITHFYMARINDPQGKFRAAFNDELGWS